MKNIGVMIERVRSYSRRLCEGIIQYCKGQDDWSLVLLDWSDLADRKSLKNFDGFIARVTDARCAEALASTGKPVVDVLCHVNHPSFATCDQNALAVGQLAVRHFMEHRFKRFAFFGHEGQPYSDRRRRAFVEGLRLHHCACDVYPTPTRVLGDFNTRIIREERYIAGKESSAIRKWISSLKKPVAVFCSNDLRAYQLASECRRAGIGIPGDVALLGVDDDELTCYFTTPAISSINPDAETIGRSAAKILDDMLNGKSDCTPHVAVKPKGLVERGSTQTYPIDPPWLSDAMVFIRANVARRLTASDVFNHLGKSHSAVDDAFRRVLDTTVSSEIAKSRIDEAERLLRQTKLPLEQVSSLSGFSTVQYFTNSFTRALGKSPGAYRADSTSPPPKDIGKSRIRLGAAEPQKASREFPAQGQTLIQ